MILSLNLKDIVGNIFHISDKEKQEEEAQLAALSKMANNTFGADQTNTNQLTNQQRSPLLNNFRSVVKPYLNNQSLTKSNIPSQALNNYMSQDSGLQTQRTKTNETINNY